MRRLLEAGEAEGKGNWCFGGKGRGGGVKINTDGNYRNRNAEDKKSHTHGERREEGNKTTHSHVRKMYIHDKITPTRQHIHAGRTDTDSETSRWMK